MNKAIKEIEKLRAAYENKRRGECREWEGGILKGNVEATDKILELLKGGE